MFSNGIKTRLSTIYSTPRARGFLLLAKNRRTKPELGTLGMEGAFRSMADGQVDENWAAEHHALWLEQLKNEPPKGAVGQPAE